MDGESIVLGVDVSDFKACIRGNSTTGPALRFDCIALNGDDLLSGTAGDESRSVAAA
jgi:hypothetical protein